MRPTEFIPLSSWQRGHHRGPGSDPKSGHREGGGSHKAQHRPPRPALLRLQGWEGHRQGENHCLEYMLDSLSFPPLLPYTSCLTFHLYPPYCASFSLPQLLFM